MSYFLLSNELVFPSVDLASKDGIIAFGGDLSIERLLLAYSSGIFPWYSEGDPIIWWSPDPRFVLFPGDLRINKSMQKVLKKNIFKITFDNDFENVITQCRDLRSKDGTWITDEMLDAYINLHKAGFAHSVEVRLENKIVGGLYGVSLGKCFFGESMFHTVDNASKAALIYLNQFLIKKNFLILDSQVYTKHLETFGAIHIPRDEYLKILNKGLNYKTLKGSWSIFNYE